MATHKTQAELDAAVLASAARITEVREAGLNRINDDEWWEALAENDRAVRARREAMKPHKAAVFRSMCLKAYRENWASEDPWNELEENVKNIWRERLAQVLAAPDEPTSGNDQ